MIRQINIVFFNNAVICVNLLTLFALLAIAIWFDIKSRRIPNWVVLTGLIASFCIAVIFDGTGLTAWGLGLVTGLTVFFPLYLFRAMGAGDVKLMAMIGAFVGPLSAIGVALTSLVAGGLLAIAVAIFTGAFTLMMNNVKFMLTGALMKVILSGAGVSEDPVSAGSVPYAVAISAGTITYLLLVHLGHGLKI